MAVPARHPLRGPGHGWQIEDDETAEAVLASLEAAGFVVLELILHRLARLQLDPNDHDLDLALKGLGTLSGRVGMTRLAWLAGVDERGRQVATPDPNPMAGPAAEAIRRVLNWLLVWDLGNPDAPPELRRPTVPPPAVRLDLDELHAAAMFLDRRARNAGVTGPGRRRGIIRRSTRRS